MQSSSNTPELAEVRTIGVQLYAKLRELGSRVTSVQPDATKLAESIQSHWRVIDSLTLRLNSSESVHNARAAVLVHAILKSTQEVFTLVGAIIPTKNPDSFAYTLFVKQKMKSMCKKTPIEALVQKIDYLRCTARLLVMTLTIGEKVRWARLFGRGNPSDRVEFETTRIDDKPAKHTLCEAVLATISSFHQDCEAVTTLIPFHPYQSTTKVTAEEEACMQEKFVKDNAEIWWRLLLDEWTIIEEKKAADLKVEEDKKTRKKPRVHVIPMIAEDDLQESHSP